MISTQRVLPFDDNICLREPCENYMKCISVLKFDSSAPFITSNTVLFRPIHPINGLRCRCPPGFTGDYCETEIDLCYSSPCSNNGRCKSREGGYSCECPEDFTGEHCEVNTRSGRCSPGVCKNGGTCINLLIGGFRCECPPGEYERPYCEMTTRSFPPQSFVTFKGLRQRFHFTVSLMFATRERNALLLYNGRFNEKHDFIAVEIIDEQIQLTFSAGEAITTVAPLVPSGVSDGQWHSVQVHYYNKPNIGRLGVPHGPSGEKVAVVTVDDCDTAVAVRFGNQIGNYSCAAQGTQTGPKKSLDLTGPLLLGGVPNLPEDFPVRNREFVGCMRNLTIDSKAIDMASYIANNGTTAGCTMKNNFCNRIMCQNGGTCVNKWNTYSCECPLSYGGKNCEQGMPSPQHFEGHGMISNSNLQFELHRGFIQMANFKFTQIRVNDGDWHHLLIELKNVKDGKDMKLLALMSLDYGMYQMNMWVNDGDWHHLLIELKNVKDGKDMKLLALMSLDYGMYQGSVEIEKELPGMTLESLFLGGLLGDDGKIEQGFVGCMQGVRLGETATNVATLNMNQGKKIRVQNGCDVSDPCDSNTCPEHSHCSDDWKTHSCVCDPGYFGRDCVDVCRLNPCKHVSACVRKPSSSHGYTCECQQNYYGQYCENKIDQPCPRGWWGNSSCGPCNCDTDKGFDPDCNKTSGECRCKANYYRPQGSDSCFPCDCFSLGAQTRTCDDETGQCQCKTGVIGRQCNRCDNPFAEVTSNGCQVIYEGCPKSFEAGVWWPKTKFGSPAAMNCPKGSVGTAVRHCSEIKGWLPPELFNCTTLTFSELKTMNEKMHRNETNMDGDKSMNIAELLQNATMHTDVFYGNDVKTAYQLISQVLEYESKQQGFDLAATRDAEFNENIIKAGSAILDPSNKEHWEQIQRTEGGTAHLLKSYEEYANNMAQNMRKTYLKPFTIVTPNMIVALDFLDDSNPESAKIPRFEQIREEYPKDLESTVKFPGAIFRPQEPKVNPTDQPLEPSDSPEVSEASAKRKRRQPEEANPHVVAVVMRSLNCNNTYIEEPDMYRTTIGESTASLDSTVRSAKSHSSYLAYKFRKDATQKPSISSSIARLEQTEGDSAKFHRNPTKTEDHDSDSDSELSADEHSSSYASSHSSDSEDDDTQLKPKWNPTTPKNNERQPLHSTPKGILKNKITYPPPLTDKNMTNRLREKLSDYNPPTIPSRTSSIGSNDGTRSAPGTGVLIKQPHRQQSREQQNGVAMNVKAGIVNGDTSDSDLGLEILEVIPNPDVVVLCCGGGGLLAGVAAAIKLSNCNSTMIYGVEPEGGNNILIIFIFKVFHITGLPITVVHKACWYSVIEQTCLILLTLAGTETETSNYSLRYQ
ncbi:UNVERIFIED_CONTAM: hypothetical protein FKN15_036694 [Acipenser sinensis]